MVFHLLPENPADTLVFVRVDQEDMDSNWDPNPALCLVRSPGQGELEFDDVIFLSIEHKSGKPKRKWREEINHSHAHDLQTHERHHPLIDIQQFPLRHDSLDIVGR